MSECAMQAIGDCLASEVAEKIEKQSEMELTFHPENMKIASGCKLLILRMTLAIFRADPSGG